MMCWSSTLLGEWCTKLSLRYHNRFVCWHWHLPCQHDLSHPPVCVIRVASHLRYSMVCHACSVTTSGTKRNAVIAAPDAWLSKFAQPCQISCSEMHIDYNVHLSVCSSIHACNALVTHSPIYTIIHWESVNLSSHVHAAWTSFFYEDLAWHTVANVP